MKYLLLVLLFASFASAGIDGTIGLNLAAKPASIVDGANYSINVNNSQYFQGYTPSTLWTYYTSLGNNLWYSILNPFNFYNSTTLDLSGYYKVDQSTPQTIQGQIIANNSNADYTNIDGAGAGIFLRNPNPNGQSVIYSEINGQMAAKWRTDYANGISWIAGAGGNHDFYVGGDYGTGVNPLKIKSDSKVLVGPNNPSDDGIGQFQVEGKTTITDKTIISPNPTEQGLNEQFIVDDSGRAITDAPQDTLSLFLGSKSFVNRLAHFNNNQADGRTEVTFSNSGNGYWSNNFVSFMVHGGNFNNNYYFTDLAGKTSDNGWAYLVAQGTYGGVHSGFGIMEFDPLPILFGTNALTAMQIAGTTQNILIGPGAMVDDGVNKLQVNGKAVFGNNDINTYSDAGRVIQTNSDNAYEAGLWNKMGANGINSAIAHQSTDGSYSQFFRYNLNGDINAYGNYANGYPVAGSTGFQTNDQTNGVLMFDTFYEGDIIFTTNSQANSIPDLVIKNRGASGGNILIGTTTDNGFKLNVDGDSYVLGQSWVYQDADNSLMGRWGHSYNINNLGTNSYLDFRSPLDTGALEFWAGDGTEQLNFNAGSFRFYTSQLGYDAETTGNVLIDTLTDDGVNKLQVNGGIRQVSVTTDGFVKYTNSDGTFGVDTNTYLTTSDASSTYVPYNGATSNVDLNGKNISNVTVLTVNGKVPTDGINTTGSLTINKIDATTVPGFASSFVFTAGKGAAGTNVVSPVFNTGGGMILTAGDGGQNTVTAGTRTAGAGGSITLTSSNGGNAIASGSANGKGGTAGSIILGAATGVGGIGGKSNGTTTGTNTGGAGSGVVHYAGIGGAASGGATNIGGAGGSFNIFGASGGAATANTGQVGVGGSGSNVDIEAGSGGSVGGTSINRTGGDGGNLTFKAGIGSPTGNIYGLNGNILFKIGTIESFRVDGITQNLWLSSDNRKAIFGAGSDASIYYDAVDLIINPKEVGSGQVKVLGNLNLTGYNVTATDFYSGNSKGLTVNKLINGSTSQCWLNYTGGILTASDC